MQRVALVRGTEDGAAQMPYPAHLFAGEAGHAAVGVTFGEENAVETVTDTVAFPAPIGGGDHHSPYDGIESGSVAPPGAHGYATNVAGHETSYAKMCRTPISAEVVSSAR